MGFKVRIRTIKTQAANGGVECSGSYTEHDMCSTETQCGNIAIPKKSVIYISFEYFGLILFTFVLLLNFVSLI